MASSKESEQKTSSKESVEDIEEAEMVPSVVIIYECTKFCQRQTYVLHFEYNILQDFCPTLQLFFLSMQLFLSENTIYIIYKNLYICIHRATIKSLWDTQLQKNL